MSKECEANGAIERFYDNHLKPMFDELQDVCGTQKRWEHLLIATFLAYGWMPTMLWRSRTPLLAKTNSAEWRKQLADSLNTLLNDYKTKRLDEDLVRTLAEFTNNSVVGLSKVLFAFDPEHFPIWDSRVAMSLNRSKNKKYVGRDVSGYIEWVETARSLVKRKTVSDRIEALRKRYSCFDGVSDLKVIEFVVFRPMNSPRLPAMADSASLR